MNRRRPTAGPALTGRISVRVKPELELKVKTQADRIGATAAEFVEMLLHRPITMEASDTDLRTELANYRKEAVDA